MLCCGSFLPCRLTAVCWGSVELLRLFPVGPGLAVGVPQELYFLPVSPGQKKIIFLSSVVFPSFL